MKQLLSVSRAVQEGASGRRTLPVALALLLAGCAAQYGPMSTESGYSDQELQPGVHYIDYRGSIGASEEQVIEFWRRRATELCPNGFAILSEQGHALAAPTTNNVAGRITARGRARCM